MRFLIAYDIADPRRLRRVAKRLEREALRCQKSVFVFDGTEDHVRKIMEELRPLLNIEEDVVQAWKLGKGERVSGNVEGTPANVRPASVVLYATGHVFVEGHRP